MPCWFQCQWMSAVIHKHTVSVAASEYFIALNSSLERLIYIFSHMPFGRLDLSAFWFLYTNFSLIFESEGALSSSKILQHKTQTNQPNQDANKKRYKKYFQSLISKLRHNMKLQQQSSTQKSLQSSIDIEMSMVCHRSSKMNKIFTHPIPYSYKTKAYSISTNQEKVLLTPALVLIMKIGMHHIKPSLAEVT